MEKKQNQPAGKTPKDPGQKPKPAPQKKPKTAPPDTGSSREPMEKEDW